MYQNPAGRLRLSEDAGVYEPTLLRAGLFERSSTDSYQGTLMTATDTLSADPAATTSASPGSSRPPVPPKIAALLAGLTALTGAVIGLMTSFDSVHWTSAQTTLVATEVAAFWALASAVTAHLWPQTKKQPVAVAGTVTAFVAATLSLGIGFAWWQLTESQNASLISLVTAIVAVATALAARSAVNAGPTPAREAETGPGTVAATRLLVLAHSRVGQNQP